LPVHAAVSGVQLQGYISKPPFTRSQGKHLYCFVNRRYIRDNLLNHAMMTAYRNRIEARRYPAAVLLLELPPQDVDVNVHPGKLNVRFRQPREIYGMVVETLAQALAQLAPQAASERYPGASGQLPVVTDYRDRVEDALKRYRLSSASGKLSFPEALTQGRHVSFSLPVHEQAGAQAEAAVAETAVSLKYVDLEYLGQVAGTYLVFSSPEQIVLLDQHAAHERILFEKLKRNSEQKHVGQRLLIPEVLHLSQKDIVFIEESISILEAAGIEAESFGGDSMVIRSVPVIGSHVDIRIMIMDMLESFSDSDRLLGFRDRQDRIFRHLACAAAVKANQPMTAQEAVALCRELDETPSAATCPHGRPVYISLDLGELEKRFKRR
jgi:DNA mismatch repair protein MutL